MAATESVKGGDQTAASSMLDGEVGCDRTTSHCLPSTPIIPWVNAPAGCIVMYGAGGHAQVVADAAQSMDLAVHSFYSDDGSGHARSLPLLPGVRSIGRNAFLDGPPQVIAIGSNDVRRTIAIQLPGPFQSILHPSARIGSGVQVGEGAMILHGSRIGAGARIGAHAIINTAARVDGSAVIEPFAHVAPHARIGTGAIIGVGVLVGAGATVAPGVTIGAWATIGAGTRVTTDIPAHATAVGDPSRILVAR